MCSVTKVDQLLTYNLASKLKHHLKKLRPSWCTVVLLSLDVRQVVDLHIVQPEIIELVKALW